MNIFSRYRSKKENALENIKDIAVYILEKEDEILKEHYECHKILSGLENRLKAEDNTEYEINQLKNNFNKQELVLFDLNSKLEFLKKKYTELHKIRQQIECDASVVRVNSLLDSVNIPGLKQQEYEKLINEVRVDLGLN